ncbi:MAG: hypothetical protein WCG42_05225 [Parachlamydiaceae bacterium]
MIENNSQFFNNSIQTFSSGRILYIDKGGKFKSTNTFFDDITLKLSILFNSALRFFGKTVTIEITDRNIVASRLATTLRENQGLIQTENDVNALRIISQKIKLTQYDTGFGDMIETIASQILSNLKTESPTLFDATKKVVLVTQDDLSIQEETTTEAIVEKETSQEDNFPNTDFTLNEQQESPQAQTEFSNETRSPSDVKRESPVPFDKTEKIVLVTKDDLSTQEEATTEVVVEKEISQEEDLSNEDSILDEQQEFPQAQTGFTNEINSASEDSSSLTMPKTNTPPEDFIEASEILRAPSRQNEQPNISKLEWLRSCMTVKNVAIAAIGTIGLASIAYYAYTSLQSSQESPTIPSLPIPQTNYSSQDFYEKIQTLFDEKICPALLTPIEPPVVPTTFSLPVSVMIPQNIIQEPSMTALQEPVQDAFTNHITTAFHDYKSVMNGTVNSVKGFFSSCGSAKATTRCSINYKDCIGKQISGMYDGFFGKFDFNNIANSFFDAFNEVHNKKNHLATCYEFSYQFNKISYEMGFCATKALSNK